KPYHKNIQECVYGSHCNRKTGYCECIGNYPLEVPQLNGCLRTENLGQHCVHSKQCEHTLNAICVDKDSVELNKVELIGNQLLRKYYRRQRQVFDRIGEKYGSADGYKSMGRCQCRAGHWIKTKGSLITCEKQRLLNSDCIGSHTCLVLDSNSHCDALRGHCICDAGYGYDTDRNQCRLNSIKVGFSCINEKECRNWDINTLCSSTICRCIPEYEYDFNSQRCKPVVAEKMCGYGLKWDDNTGGCEALHLYGLRQNDYRFFSTDKLLETIVIVIFCCVTIAILRFWRNILPQHIYTNQTGMFSDFSYTNRVPRRRHSRNSVSRSGRVIQLRVNLDSPDSQFLPEEAFVDLPLTASQSSLPPYTPTTTVDLNHDSQPPPYTDDPTDDPPTYEEAIALSQTTQSDDKVNDK
ncbi:unnamed protein product, partial [Medioppia subpectinata]